jgi:rsbT co-antagonist protein RsbR
VSEAVTVEILTRLLRRVPGANWSCRVNTRTGQRTWLYVDARMAEMYDTPEDEIRAEPDAVLERLLPEDRARLKEVMAIGFQSLSPAAWAGRILRRSGEIRWIDSHVEFEQEADGSIIVYGQVLDVTERHRLELALGDTEATLRKAEELQRTVIDALPVGVMLASQAKEMLIFNPAQEQMVGGMTTHEDGDVTRAYGVFLSDGVTPLLMEDSGMTRALRGEEHEEELFIRNPRMDAPVLQRYRWKPMRDDIGDVYAALGVAEDITLQRKLETELRQRNAELASSEAAKTELIEKLRYSIGELSTPILEVWDDVLVMPVIGVVDSRRTADMVQRLLAEVARSQASYVIVDLTGVEIVDTRTADHLIKLIRKVEVVGARCVLTGIRPAVAETLVEIGVDFGRITTLRNLKHGLRDAIRTARREHEGAQSDRGAHHLEAHDSAPRRRAR